MNVRLVESWIGWPLLLCHFFLEEPWKECILALQTILCALLIHNKHTYHIATLVIAFQYIVCQDQGGSIFSMIMYHTLLFCAVCAQYAFRDQGVSFWVALAWSMHWLGSLSAPAWRHVVKCLLFHQVASTCLVGKKIIHGFKWSWIVVSHEISWCMIPVQMLYEVYIEKDTHVQNPIFE